MNALVTAAQLINETEMVWKCPDCSFGQQASIEEEYVALPVQTQETGCLTVRCKNCNLPIQLVCEVNHPY